MVADRPVLALNADASVLGVWAWPEAVRAVLTDKAQVLAEYGVVVRSPSMSVPLPSVMILRRHSRMFRLAPFTRRNVFLAYATPTRDGPRWTCALSGEVVRDRRLLTFEHVVPRSRGGSTSWDNVVLAAQGPNNAKGDRTLAEAGMRLHVTIRRPTEGQVALASVACGYRDPPADWRDYLGGADYWDVPLDP